MLLPSREADALLREARATTRRVARTFTWGCRLLPRGIRDDVHLLYLVLRTLDDLVDDGDPGAAARIAAVEDWVATGRVASREARLLAVLDRRHDLPRHAVAEFCAGMRHDLEAAPIVSEEDLERYCFRVAGTVGIMMSALLGLRTDEATGHRAAAALGCAMQRTNIVRDIDEDLTAGRVYIPERTLARHGGSLRPGERQAIVREQIALADALYDEGLAGVRYLRSGRLGVRAAGLMYREILRQVEREGCGVRPGRAVVPGRRKLLAGTRACLGG